VAVINWDWLPDLTGRSPEDIRRCLDEHDAYTETQPGVVTKNANEIFAFANEILVGDLSCCRGVRRRTGLRPGL
jgi:predicted Mrr-cat superfamily restriction endonuclease